MSNPRRAIFAASLDPITTGHLWVIREAVRLFDEVIVGIGINPAKASKYMFSAEERIKITRDVCQKENLRVDVKEIGSIYLSNFAKIHNAQYVVRGVRNSQDYEFERTMSQINSKMNPGLTTIVLMPPSDIAEVSSSFVKSLIGYEGWQKEVSKYVPTSVALSIFEKVK